MGDTPEETIASGQAPEHTDLHLELCVGTPQIAGALTDGAGGRRSFSGWLELVPLLEALRGAPAESEQGDGG